MKNSTTFLFKLINKLTTSKKSYMEVCYKSLNNNIIVFFTR